jgi:hypothetical protein
MPEYVNELQFYQLPTEYGERWLKQEKERVESGDKDSCLYGDRAAETLLRMLQLAFEAGRENKAAEIRAALGSPKARY